MKRINYPLTLEELKAEIEIAIKKFGGKKYVLLADDEEGNGFHECYCTFMDAKKISDCCFFPNDLAKKDCVILG